MIRILTIFMLMMPLQLAAQGIAYSDAQTQTCLDTLSEGGAMTDCVGLSAGACMEANDAGYTTAGMGGCLSGELKLWDTLLNSEYQIVLKQAKDTDAEMKDLGATVPSITDALVAMQRAWIPFRDEACAYEHSLWGGGTGGGPATLQCLLELTAAQAERLSRRMGD
ncbi:MAG: lysozyme inhibitor LprI family protein [Paracoccaceae bacterium]|nr:lysozyme inhibitor LprI family protein [Paracoccaceae bacterium]